MGKWLWCVIACTLVLGCSDDPTPPIDTDADMIVPDMEHDLDDAGADSGDMSDLDDIGPDMEPDMGLPPFVWPVPTGPIQVTPHQSWKERITYWDDGFIRGDFNQVRWVKFTVLMRDPSRVIFQDSNAYAFHHTFASERLDPFLGMTRAAFDAISLYEEGQEAILGAVLFPPLFATNELGIQLVRQDDYHPEMVRIIFELVKASIDETEAVRSFYFPSFEQVASTVRWASEYVSRQIPVSSVERWHEGDACYSAGWALGRLVYAPGPDVYDAYLRGDLLNTDILLTDGVPAEVPPVAGIVSLTPGTPNSHVAILANSFGIPFVFLRTESKQQEVMNLVGQTVALRARVSFEGALNCDVTLTSADDVPQDVRDGLLALKVPEPLVYTQKQTSGVYHLPTENLVPSDIGTVGGKAANFGLLRRAIPENTPAPLPIAITFDLWDQFMLQTIPGGQTLGAEIAARLAPFGTYPPPAAELETALDEIRTMIRDQTQFTPQQQAGVIAALDGFDPLTKIRFRSSTNVEDAENFTGAGLYDSYSGCLQDDLDADTLGPSHCDPSEANERGVFRAIRRVFASFYNTRAYLERLRYSIDESTVGMAMLVHYSDPDETEMANGVVTLHRVNPQYTKMTIVTQPGAASVTNPSDNAQPEIVEIEMYSFGTYSTLVQGSDLLPIAQTTLEYSDEYIRLAGLLARVANEFAAFYPAKNQFLLDFEYKKLVPGRLIVRQVRELPLVPPNSVVAPVLIGGVAKLCTFQGEYSDVFANHRNKARWQVGMRSALLSESELEDSLLTTIDGEMLVDDSIQTLQGAAPALPDYTYRFGDSQTEDSWSLGAVSDRRQYSLQTFVPLQVPTSQTPLLFPSDLESYLKTTFTQGQPYWDWSSGIATRTEDFVRLTPCPPAEVDATYNPRDVRLDFAPGVFAQTLYLWPPSPTGLVAGYTAPLTYFERTTFTGLLSTPVVLDTYFAQTYRPEHHNFGENFYFDFALQPNLPQADVNVLRSRDIRAVLSLDGQPYVIGFDGKLRAWP